MHLNSSTVIEIGFGRAHSLIALFSLPLLSPLGTPSPPTAVLGSTPPSPTLVEDTAVDTGAVVDVANAFKPKVEAVVVVLANPARLNPDDTVDGAVIPDVENTQHDKN